MKISCFVASLAPGGAERVMSFLVNAWADAGHETSLVTIADATADAYDVDRRVRRIGLGLMRESRWLGERLVLNLRRVRALRRAIGSLQPDVVVSFHAQLNVLAVVACRRLGVPVIVSERVYPPSHDIGASWAALRRLTYRFADAVVVQSDAARAWASSMVALHRVHVIPNAVSHPFVNSHRVDQGRLAMVLGIGRLVPQKGFDLLIRAFAAIAPRHASWSLTIVGDGPERESLRTLADQLLPPTSVAFVDTVSDPERYYRQAAIFVLPSRFEGFPNVLLEAMACGCAVIASDCPAGPSEIVREGLDGVLVPPDQEAPLAEALERLMGDAEGRRQLGAKARDVATRFAPARIMGLWHAAIEQVLK